MDGRFKSQWDHNDVDEVYEVDLNAKLTRGIALSITNDRKQTAISYLVTKPIVTRWRCSLVASEGKVLKVLYTTQPNKKTGK